MQARLFRIRYSWTKRRWSFVTSRTRIENKPDTFSKMQTHSNVPLG